MPRVGPACAVSKLSGTFDENELELAASPGPRRAGSSIDPTSADKIKKLEAALEQVLVFFVYILSFLPKVEFITNCTTAASAV